MATRIKKGARIGADSREWVGARVELPGRIVDEGPAYYPLFCLWIELPEGVIVGSQVVRPSEAQGSLGESLIAAMRAPMIGPPRIPRRIRVATQELAAEVQRSLRGVAGIPVLVAPTPEADRVLAEFHDARYPAPDQADVVAEENDPVNAAAARARVGRNAPCPCGSGKKYKKCHFDADRRAGAQRAVENPAPRSPAAHIHALDRRLLASMAEWARARFGAEWLPSDAPFADPRGASQLYGAWALHIAPIGGRSIADWFEAEEGKALGPEERAWLAAQRKAWLSVWEAEEVRAGVGMRLRDLLSGEVRDVVEVGASQTVVRRDALLARVVDHTEMSVICGTYDRSLPPREAAEVVRMARNYLRRKRDVPVDRLRDPAVAARLIRWWEEILADLIERRSLPPMLSNSDGDPILMTVDHFNFDPAARGRLESTLAAMEGAQPRLDGDEPGVVSFARPGNKLDRNLRNTIVAVVRVGEGQLRSETNSLRRADDFRARLEGACGDLLHHRVREHQDPRSSARSPQPPSPPDDDPELQRVTRQLKGRYYATWPDEPLPALKGKTPRQAVRTAAGRAQVELLLKELENWESRSPPLSRYDTAPLRATLGLT